MLKDLGEDFSRRFFNQHFKLNQGLLLVRFNIAPVNNKAVQAPVL